MSVIHINIGSNTGDRAALIERAVAAVADRLNPDGRSTVKRSPAVESEPWGYVSDRRFLNIGLMIETDAKYTEDDAIKLLKTLLEIEKGISAGPHRNEDGTYTDREIDIDLIAVDGLVADRDGLLLPHPRMHLRPFVLGPMEYLDPDWVHPVTGQTPAEMLRLCSQNSPLTTSSELSGVRRQ